MGLLERKTQQVIKILDLLRVACQNFPPPASVEIVKEYGRDPFLVLISCILSLRAKDTASLPASRELFKQAKTPYQLELLSLEAIEKVIYSVGYYRSKARQVKSIAQELTRRFHGKVPDTYDELISIKGVGPKTANLVLAEAFEQDRLYVDIHVHRISNRIGLVKTKSPEQTQAELEKIVPKQYWREYSRLLVTWGQNVCVPISPWCSQCAIYQECQRVNVAKRR